MSRSRKNEKGILEVGFFIELKKQAHYPTSPCGPQAAGTATDIVPLPRKPKGIRKEAEDMKF